MDIYTKLKSLLAASSVRKGTIISASGNTITVATESGSSLIQRQVGDITNYQLGTDVDIQNNFIIGVTQSASQSIKYPIR